MRGRHPNEQAIDALRSQSTLVRPAQRTPPVAQWAVVAVFGSYDPTAETVSAVDGPAARWGPDGSAQPEAADYLLDGLAIRNTRGKAWIDGSTAVVQRTRDEDGDEFWDVTDGGIWEIDFYLDENLAIGGSADATVLLWSAGDTEYQAIGPQIEVFDQLAMFANVQGSWGKARWAVPRYKWEIYQLQPRCLWALVTVDGDHSSSETEIAVDAVVRWGPPGSPEPTFDSGQMNGLDVRRDTFDGTDFNDDSNIFVQLTQDDADPPVEYWDWHGAECYVAP